MAVDSNADKSTAVPPSQASRSSSGGGAGNVVERASSEGAEPPADSIVGTAGDGTVQKLGHDDFDPVGTLALILIYFSILVVMWVFMYFVEFLGRGVSVVG